MYNATRTCAHCGPRYVCIAAACKARAALQGCLGSFLKHRHVQTTHSKQASEKTLSGWTKGVKVTAAVQRSGLLHRTHWTHAPGRLAAGGRQAQAAKNAVFRQFQRRCAVHEVRTSVLSGLPAQREVHERPVEQQPAHQRGACATRARIHSSQALNINKSQPPARRRLSMLVAHAMSETATLMRAPARPRNHTSRAISASLCRPAPPPPPLIVRLGTSTKPMCDHPPQRPKRKVLQAGGQRRTVDGLHVGAVGVLLQAERALQAGDRVADRVADGVMHVDLPHARPRSGWG
jgi:hypothetical protein